MERNSFPVMKIKEEISSNYSFPAARVKEETSNNSSFPAVNVKEEIANNFHRDLNSVNQDSSFEWKKHLDIMKEEQEALSKNNVDFNIPPNEQWIKHEFQPDPKPTHYPMVLVGCKACHVYILTPKNMMACLMCGKPTRTIQDLANA